MHKRLAWWIALTEEKGKEEEGRDDWDGINTQVGRNELEEMEILELGELYVCIKKNGYNIRMALIIKLNAISPVINLSNFAIKHLHVFSNCNIVYFQYYLIIIPLCLCISL